MLGIERPKRAVLTGLEPATSTLTGWRANQLLYRTLHAGYLASGAPNGIRTRAAALKGRCPRPLDDGGEDGYRRREPLAPAVGDCPSIGDNRRARQSVGRQPRRTFPPPPANITDLQVR
jgi:hypothetical protein